MSESMTTALERTKVKPILFSGPMVRALLEGRKTQTRRVLKLPNSKGESRRGEWEASTVGGPGVMSADGTPFPEQACVWHPKAGTIVVPPYKPGDLLWVRETSLPDFPKEFSYYDSSWAEVPTEYRSPQHVLFKASWTGHELTWHPSIHMPRWASRLTLEVTAVKVERLQEISEADALAEGVTKVRDHCYVIRGFDYDLAHLCHSSPVTPFAKLWDHLNAKRGYGWEESPWVVAVSFRVHKMNVDTFLAQREAA